MAKEPDRPAPMVARSGFATYHDGVPRHIRRGDVVGGDDPILRTHADQFRPVDDLVEKTTAWPGERRAVRFPERVTAKEASAQAGTPQHRTHRTPEEAVGHALPPEDENSAASTFAPLQPGANVVADDVPDEQMPEGAVRAKDAPVADMDSPAVSTANVSDEAEVETEASEEQEQGEARDKGDSPEKSSGRSGGSKAAGDKSSGEKTSGR